MQSIWNEHAAWIGYALVFVIIAVLATSYTFWRKRGIDRGGPRKGEAANPSKVRRQNPPT